MSASPNCLDDHARLGIHSPCVVEAPNFPAGQGSRDIHQPRVGGDPIYIRSDHPSIDAHRSPVAAEQFPHSANADANSTERPLSGALICLDDQGLFDPQDMRVVEVPNVPAGRGVPGTHRSCVGGDPNIRSGQMTADGQGEGVAAELYLPARP